MLSSWICLLGSVLCGAQESQLVTRELERAQIEGALVALGSLNSPCRFRLDAVEILIARTDPFFESLPGRELMALCESGADGSASTRCEDLHAAFEALSQDFEPRALNFSWRRFELDVAMTPEQQVQRSPHAFDEQTASLYKCPAFNLIYDNYEGSRHQLRLSSPSASPLLFDLHLLMSPVMFEPFQLHGWREYTWEELEGIDPGVLAVRLAPRGSVRLISDVLWEKNWTPGGLSHLGEKAGPQHMILMEQCPDYRTRFPKVASYCTTRVLVADIRRGLWGALWRDVRAFRKAGLLDGGLLRLWRDHREVRRYRRDMRKPGALASIVDPPRRWD